MAALISFIAYISELMPEQSDQTDNVMLASPRNGKRRCVCKTRTKCGAHIGKVHDIGNTAHSGLKMP